MLTPSERRGPLHGLRIVDCSRGTAGPRATGLLADYGADVIWVEPPGGDPYRDTLAVPYSVFNRGKRSVVLDLHDSRDSNRLLDLLATADVFVQSWRPGVADRLGLEFGAVHEVCPGLVYVSISGFGQKGRYRDTPGYEAIVHAVTGTMADQVGHRSGPIFEALPFASIGAAFLAVIGVLASIYRRHSDGWGRNVETSLFDGALAYMMMWGTNDLRPPNPRPVGDKRAVVRTMQCSDGVYLQVHTGAVGAFNRLLKVLELDDRIAASESGLDLSLAASEEEARILDEEVPIIFASRPSRYWTERLLESDVCVVPALRQGEVFNEPQTAFNEMIVEVGDPVLGKLRQIAPALRMRGWPAVVRGAAPRAGQHNEEVLAELAHAPRVSTTRPERGPMDEALLRGVKIVDLGAYYAGPFSSRLLADLGAEVIKLETLAGDPMRYRDEARCQPFNSCQAGKRAISVDLKRECGRGISQRLFRWADIVSHNMRPGAAERLGCSYEDVVAVNPEAIYVYAPGWGSSGPFAHRQSFAPLMSGYVGIGFEVAGEYNPPLFPIANEDTVDGLLGAVAMLIALIVRQHAGGSQFVESPQLNAALGHVSHHVLREDGALLGSARLDPLQFGISALERLYETSDGWLCLVARTEAHWEALESVVGLPLSSDIRFGTPASRSENDYFLGQILADSFATLSTDEWLRLLRLHGVPAAEPSAHNNERFMHDAENVEMGRVAVIPHRTLGHVREFDQLLRLSDAQIPVHRHAPGLGEHTDTLLGEFGYDAEAIRDLRNRQVVR